jgi:hypothetical protein
LATSDGTNEDGQLGTADAAGDTNSIRNMRLIGRLVVTSTNASHDMTASGVCEIETRYVSPCIHNNTTDGLIASNDVCSFVLTPVPDEVQ